MSIPHPEQLKQLLRRRMRRLGLSTHITAAFALTGLFLSTVTALATLGLARQNLLKARESASFSVFISNSRRVLNELTTETDDEGRRAIVERLSQASGTFPLLLVGDNWTAADPLVFGSKSVPASLLELVNTGKPGRIRTRIGDRTAIVSALPISRIGVEATYFEAASLDDTEDTLNTLATILFGVAATSTMLSAFLGSWASRRLLNPLVEVRTAAESLASGALDTRLEPPGDADLASLTASFNEMARSLEDRIAREARFTSTVSHELRSPLMTLTATAEILANSADQLDESSRIALGLLVDDIARFNRLLEDLLEINRYDIGIADLQPELIRIMEFIRQTASIYPAVDLSFDTASVTEDTALWADKRRLRQVVANLLANAVNYGSGEVIVGVESRADRLLLSVEDNGPGVIPEERDSIFERFARGRAGSRRGRGSGTGLGLSLVAEHVSLHHGRVWAEDRSDGDPGARFVVELPIIANSSEHGEGESLEDSEEEGGYGEDPRGHGNERIPRSGHQRLPGGEAGAVHDRTDSTDRTGAAQVRTAAATLLGAAVLATAGCGVPLDETAQAVDDSALPESLRPGVTPPTAVETGSEALASDSTVYLLTTPQDTERTLAAAVTRPTPPYPRLDDVLSTLFGKSTTPEEADSGYFNTLELFKMNSVSLGDDMATVDIGLLPVEDTPTAEETPTADQLKQAAVQLVFTISDWGVNGTRILLNGEEVSIPTSDADADPGEVLRINAYEQFQPDFNAAPTPSSAASR